MTDIKDKGVAVINRGKIAIKNKTSLITNKITSLFKRKGGKNISLVKTKERVVVFYKDKKYKRNVLTIKNKRYVRINKKFIRIH